MKHRSICVAVVLVGVLLAPSRCPAPFIYRAGEGWSYEPVGGSRWERTRAKDQLEVAQEAFNKKEYRVALKASRRVVARWPFSDYAPKAQYLVARCYSARHKDERAFKEYQKLLEKYPKVDNYQEVVHQQFEISNRYLAGQWFKLWGYIPFFPSMEKTVAMYEKLIKNGPYSDVAPHAQMNIGEAREKQHAYDKAVKAYEKAGDRYQDKQPVASEAMFKAGLAYNKQAKTAEYDQSVAGKAIATFSDFAALYPEDPRVNKTSQIISSLKTEQARGSIAIAKFYESKREWRGAIIYYNEAANKDPESRYAAEAKQRIKELMPLAARQAARQAARSSVKK
jgi:outer membrane protein assembly factor BamD (BamD/ComL family)